MTETHFLTITSTLHYFLNSDHLKLKHNILQISELTHKITVATLKSYKTNTHLKKHTFRILQDGWETERIHVN
jgi:hypothetical protein